MVKRLATKYAEELRYVTVGSIGFSVNFVALWLLHGRLHLNIVPAQLIASELAVLSNFSLHHNWTYRDFADDRLWKRITKFHASAWTGAGLSSIILWVGVALGLQYLVALVVGAAFAMVWNYLINKYVVWAKKHPIE